MKIIQSIVKQNKYLNLREKWLSSVDLIEFYEHRMIMINDSFYLLDIIEENRTPIKDSNKISFQYYEDHLYQVHIKYLKNIHELDKEKHLLLLNFDAFWSYLRSCSSFR